MKFILHDAEEIVRNFRCRRVITLTGADIGRLVVIDVQIAFDAHALARIQKVNLVCVVLP